MGKTKINTYAALLLITIVGGGACYMIVDTAATAQANADAYYQSVNDEAFGTSTIAVFAHNRKALAASSTQHATTSSSL